MFTVLPFDDQTCAEGHEVPQAHPQRHHSPAADLVSRLAVGIDGRLHPCECHLGAEHHYDIDDRPSQHVANAATQRHALAQQPPHDWDNAALAHREEQAEKSADSDGKDMAPRNNPRDKLLWDELLEQAGDHRSQHDEWHRLIEDTGEYDDEILDVFYRHYTLD